MSNFRMFNRGKKNDKKVISKISKTFCALALAEAMSPALASASVPKYVEVEAQNNYYQISIELPDDSSYETMLTEEELQTLLENSNDVVTIDSENTDIQLDKSELQYLVEESQKAEQNSKLVNKICGLTIVGIDMGVIAVMLAAAIKELRSPFPRECVKQKVLDKRLK